MQSLSISRLYFMSDGRETPFHSLAILRTTYCGADVSTKHKADNDGFAASQGRRDGDANIMASTYTPSLSHSLIFGFSLLFRSRMSQQLLKSVHDRRQRSASRTFSLYSYISSIFHPFPDPPAMEKEKSVLITGCSEGGIGDALAQEFLKKGLKVFATARNLKSVQHLKEIGCEVCRLDVTNVESVKDAVEFVGNKTVGSWGFWLTMLGLVNYPFASSIVISLTGWCNNIQLDDPRHRYRDVKTAIRGQLLGRALHNTTILPLAPKQQRHNRQYRISDQLSSRPTHKLVPQHKGRTGSAEPCNESRD